MCSHNFDVAKIHNNMDSKIFLNHSNFIWNNFEQMLDQLAKCAVYNGKLPEREAAAEGARTANEICLGLDVEATRQTPRGGRLGSL